MKKVQIVLAASLGLLLSACASNQAVGSKKNQAVADNEDMVCIRTAGVGSHLKKKRCITKAQAEIEKEGSKEMMRQGFYESGAAPSDLTN